MSADAIKTLELKIDELILLCNQLNMENKALKRKSADWQQERSQLIEKHSVVRRKMETTLDKLRSVESIL